MSAGYQGMGVSSYVTEVGNAQEVVFTLAGGLGEANTGGPQMNIIGKQGGNMFAGSFFINGTGSAFQGTNLTPELQAKGLTTPQSLAKAWDINPAFGGPIVRDKLWFFGTFRYQSQRPECRQHVGQPECRRQHQVDVSPRRWQERPAAGGTDRRRQVEERLPAVDLAGDAEKQDQLLVTDYQQICQHCIQGGSSSGLTFAGTIASPEALQRVENRPNSMTQIAWTSPVTSQAAARRQRSAGALLLVGRHAEEFVRYDDDSGAGRRPASFRASTTGRATGRTIPASRTSSRDPRRT